VGDGLIFGATVGKCVEADSRVGGYFRHPGKKKLQYSSFESAPSSLPRSLVVTALSFAIFVLLDFLVRPAFGFFFCSLLLFSLS
jgi:hypothetical protein